MYFVEGYFEIPEIRTTELGESVNEVQLQGENLAVFEGLKASKMVMDILVSKLDTGMFRVLLNDVFIARRYYSAKDRQHPRTKMVVDLLEHGVNSSLVPLIEKSEYDVLDASVIENDYLTIRQFYMSL